MTYITVDMSELKRLHGKIEGVQAVAVREIRLGMSQTTSVIETEVSTLTPVNTGALRASIGTTLYGSPSGVYSAIVGTPLLYGEVVERGRRPGKMPPVGAIKLWIVRKGIATGSEADSVAYLIARKIARVGTKGAWMFRNGLRRSLPRVRQIWDNRMKAIVEALKK